MDAFTYEPLPSRVVFGRGTLARLDEELARLGAERALVLTTPQQAAEGERLLARLGPRGAGVFAGAVMHTPVDVTIEALKSLQASGADAVVALGGGSTIGLGKALALRTDVKQLCIPTTYAGSEMTPILGQTENGAKTTLRSLKVLPETVIYDIDLTLTLPPGMSGTSGINAIAHAVEALYAQERNPIVSLMAEQAVCALARALPRISDQPQDIEARAEALYGSWLCGSVLGLVGMALHHKLCHTLGGTFDLPHAETHTVVLPHATAYNAPAATEAMSALSRALGSDRPARALFDLAGRVGARRALKDLGMPESGIELAADQAMSNPYWNPRPLERQAIRDLIAAAWAGDPPEDPVARAG